MFKTTSTMYSGVRVHAIAGKSIDLRLKTDMRAVVFYVGKSGTAIGKEYHWDSQLYGFGFMDDVVQALTDAVVEDVVAESVDSTELAQEDIMSAWADAVMTPLGRMICNSTSQQGQKDQANTSQV